MLCFLRMQYLFSVLFSQMAVMLHIHVTNCIYSFFLYVVLQLEIFVDF